MLVFHLGNANLVKSLKTTNQNLTRLVPPSVISHSAIKNIYDLGRTGFE